MDSSQLAYEIMAMMVAAIPVAASAPAQGSISSAGAGITGGYKGDSFSLKVIIAFLCGLSIYNALELLLLTMTTFNQYGGLYFWSLIVSGSGIIPYSLGFMIKFFQLLDPASNSGYVAVVLLTIGWWAMVTGQSVVLWSRLHLVMDNPRLLRWTLYMIIINVIILHIPTTVLTFGSNSNGMSRSHLQGFVNGYSVMEKIQMVGFCLQELIISSLYIKETLKLLRLSRNALQEKELEDQGQRHPRKTMYQLLAINIIIVLMDAALLGVEFANLYIIETTLKGVVYSIKLKLEFAVLSKLVHLVRSGSGSVSNGTDNGNHRRSTMLELEKSHSGNGTLPEFVDPHRVSGDLRFADGGQLAPVHSGSNGSRRRSGRREMSSWLGVELDKHNIGPLNEEDIG